MILSDTDSLYQISRRLYDRRQWHENGAYKNTQASTRRRFNVLSTSERRRVVNVIIQNMQIQKRKRLFGHT